MILPNFSAVCHTFGTYRPGSAKRKSPWVLDPGAVSCLERLVPKVRVELTRSHPHRFLRPTATESPGNTSTYYSLSPGTHYAGGYVLTRSGNCRSLSHDLSHAVRSLSLPVLTLTVSPSQNSITYRPPGRPGTRPASPRNQRRRRDVAGYKPAP